MLKKIFPQILKLQTFIVLICFLGACAKKAPEAKKEPVAAVQELHIFTWSDYLKDELIRSFEKENNVKVKQDFFSSNEEMLAKVQATIQGGAQGYDVIFPSDYMVQNMMKLNLLNAIQKEKLGFLGDFSPQFLNPAYDPSLTHSVPFAYGTTGLAINTKLAKSYNLDKGISWKDFFEKKEFKKKVSLLDDAKEVLHALLLMQGKKWSEVKEKDVQEAFAYLKKNKAQIRIFTPQASPVAENNECTLCQMYSGDALQLMKTKPELKYLVPREGGTIWTDNMAIPKNAANVELAYKFINKLLSVEGAKVFTEHSFFASPNARAMALLDQALITNKALFPDKETFKRLAYLNERTELLSLIDRLWTELKVSP